MPKAVSNKEEVERHELKTCEGAWIDVRRLTYGEKLKRRAMVSKMQLSSSKGSKDFAGEMQLVNEQATLFDFQNCIVDHNLERDDEGNKLNLGNINDISLLDPRIGEEIDNILSELNNFEADEGN
jgi:hypothetical protein